MAVTEIHQGATTIPRFHGKYSGVVYDNNDPTKQMRLRCTVPYVLGDQVSVWALPGNTSSGIQTGMFIIPSLNANVWVEFLDGDPSQPIWVPGPPVLNPNGSGMNIPESVKNGYPNVASIKTSSGHEITFNNNVNAPAITITSAAGHVITLSDVNKNISITSVGGHVAILDDLNKRIQMIDSAGNKFLMNAQAGQLKIEHQLQSGEYSLMNTADHSIQHVASKVGLGDTAANLTNAEFSAFSQAAMTAFENNLFIRRLNDLEALITAMITSGVPNAGTILANLATLAHISIPSGSSIVRIAQASVIILRQVRANELYNTTDLYYIKNCDYS